MVGETSGVTETVSVGRGNLNDFVSVQRSTTIIEGTVVKPVLAALSFTTSATSVELLKETPSGAIPNIEHGRANVSLETDPVAPTMQPNKFVFAAI